MMIGVAPRTRLGADEQSLLAPFPSRSAPLPHIQPKFAGDAVSGAGRDPCQSLEKLRAKDLKTMSISKTLSTTAAIAAVAALNIVSLGSAAQAFDGHRDWHRDWHRDGHRWGHPAPAYRHAPPPHYGYRHEEHRGRDKSLARGLAIGLGAVIVGSILAAEASRKRQYDEAYDE